MLDSYCNVWMVLVDNQKEFWVMTLFWTNVSRGRKEAEMRWVGYGTLEIFEGHVSAEESIQSVAKTHLIPCNYCHLLSYQRQTSL